MSPIHSTHAFLGRASGAAARALTGAALAWLALAGSVLASAPQGTTAPGTAPAPAAPEEGAGPADSLVPPPPAAEDVTLLRLRDAGPRFGAIVGHTAEHLEFALLATGGVVRVPWSMVEPGQSAELQQRFGYVDVVSEEIFIDAERLVLTSGATIEGVIISREGADYVVKTEGNLQQVPKSRVATIEQGLRVPALDVYSAEELYNQYAALASPTDPKAQWELAETCERLYSFTRAAEHYKKVAELDPTYRAVELANLLPRVLQKVEQEEQIGYLREADRLRKRGYWDQAFERLQAFATLFPKSVLQADADKQLARFVQARDAFAKDFVAKRWFYWMRRLTRELAREDTLAAARAHADERLSEEIQKAVLADLQAKVWKEAQLEQVKKVFAERRKVRYESTTYSAGTWLLGLEAAQRGAEEVEEPKADPANPADAQRAELAQRIKQFMKNQRVAAGGRRAQEEEDLSQAFWERFPSSNRAMWLLAYYVENSGDLEVRPRPTLLPCNTCAGRGAIEVLLTGGGGAPDSSRGGSNRNAADSQQLQKCPTCQGVQVVRKVHFR